MIRIHAKSGAAVHAVLLLLAAAATLPLLEPPLAVRLRTMQKNLAHASLCEDSIDCGVASGDFLLTFRRAGKNPVPVKHPVGMLDYAGERMPPADVLPYRGWTGKQTENRFSHWIWRQYADCMWDDIRMNRVLPYREARDSE